ncbi:PapD-like protein [Dichotomocladium elegans]|nr:PapD-like protein [Dichotomocladium elegans]
MSIHLVPSSQLSFKRPLIHGSRETLLVINSGNDPVMFKVKTTAPKQYTVKPNAGRIEPQSQVEVQVMLQSFKEEPPADYKCKDKFLVQWAAIKPVYEALPISEMWGITELEDRESIHQQKLKVNFLAPIPTVNEEQEESEAIMNRSPIVEPIMVRELGKISFSKAEIED